MGLFEFVIAGLCLNITCPVDYNNQLADTRFCVNVTCPEDSNVVELEEVVFNKKAILAQLMADLRQETLVVTTLENEILSGTESINSTLQGTGVAFDLFGILQHKYKFNYTVIKPKENVWGEGGVGVLELLKHKQANISAAFLPILRKYNDYVSYSPNLDTGEWVVLMKRPKESASGSGLLAPFTLPVWLLILISLLVVGPVIYFVIYLQAKLCKNEDNRIFPLPACIWFVYGALLKQGSTLNPITDSSRLLFSTWWIFITILTAFYTANLTAFLTLSKFTLPIGKPEDMSEKKTRWVSSKGNALEDTADEMAPILGQARNFADINDSLILNQFVDQSNMMFIREKPIIEYTMYNNYKEKTKQGIEEAKRCTYVITKFSVASYPRAFAYSKGFRYRPLFDSTIRHLVEAGIIKYKLREELPDTEICPLDLGNKERQLRNSDLMLTYEIVIGGFVISLIVFLIELVIRRMKNRKIKIDEPPQHFTSTIAKPKKQGLDVNLNNNHVDLGHFPFNSKFASPPPSYYTLFTPAATNEKVRKKIVNGREYWVYEDDRHQGSRMVPLRTPSALLFQFTN